MRRGFFNPYKGMKNIYLFVWLCQTASALFCGAGLFASDITFIDNLAGGILSEAQADKNLLADTQISDEQEIKPKLTAKEFFNLFGWSVLWSGSWEEGTHIVPSGESNLSNEPVLFGTLQNRGELKLSYLPLGLTLRGQVLDRRKLELDQEPPWSDPEKRTTNYMGGLYHKPTGSRMLYGVLDEWGLPARIRNPWIRSPPYAENHKPVIADLKNAPNSTKKDEVYLYLSTPALKFPSDIKLRGFISAQHEIEADAERKTPFEFTPAVSGGIDLSFNKNTALVIENFYFGKTLPPSKVSKWFSYPPPLPEREFDLYAAAVLFSCPDFSISSDFALSDTFAWGADFYANLGVSISPLLPSGTRTAGSIKRPLLISLAADVSGERFVNRDGANLKEGFRTAAKIEWKSRYSSLLRINTVLRFSSFGGDLSHVSAGVYYRFPSSARNTSLFRLTRISFSADRNSENPLKIGDGYSGNIGVGIRNLFTVNFAGSLKGLTVTDDAISDWNWTSAAANCEVIWSPKNKNKNINLQFRPRVECNFFAEKDEKWELSLNSSVRFKYGRISFKVSSPDFPDKWNWTLTWRYNIQQNDKF